MLSPHPLQVLGRAWERRRKRAQAVFQLGEGNTRGGRKREGGKEESRQYEINELLHTLNYNYTNLHKVTCQSHHSIVPEAQECTH